jgi:hypothetical protein
MSCICKEVVSLMDELTKYTYPEYGVYVLKLGSKAQLPSPYCNVPLIPDFREFVVHDCNAIIIIIERKIVSFSFIMQIYKKNECGASGLRPFENLRDLRGVD